MTEFEETTERAVHAASLAEVLAANMKPGATLYTLTSEHVPELAESPLVWAAFMIRNAPARLVTSGKIGRVPFLVSSVFCGMDRRKPDEMKEGEPPLVFETIILPGLVVRHYATRAAMLADRDECVNVAKQNAKRRDQSSIKKEADQ